MPSQWKERSQRVRRKIELMRLKRIRKKKREKEFEIEDSGTDEDDSEY